MYVCTTYAGANWHIRLNMVATRTFDLVVHWQILAAFTKENMNFGLCLCVPDPFCFWWWFFVSCRPEL